MVDSVPRYKSPAGALREAVGMVLFDASGNIITSFGGGSIDTSTLATETTLAALSAKLDPASASAPISQDVGVVYDGVTPYTVKRTFGSAATSGDNAIVALVASKKISLLYAKITASAAVNWKWRSATTDISALEYGQGAGAGSVEAANGLILRETAAGVALNLNLSAAVAVGYDILYIERT